MSKLDEELNFIEQDNWPHPDFKKGFPEVFKAAKAWAVLMNKAGLSGTGVDWFRQNNSQTVDAVLEALSQYNGKDGDE